jgi:hypothetical protein
MIRVTNKYVFIVATPSSHNRLRTELDDHTKGFRKVLCIPFSTMKFAIAVAALVCLLRETTAFSPVSTIQRSSPFMTSSEKKTANTKLYGEYGASSTSFYTDVEKQDSYESIDDVLGKKCKDEKVREVIMDMLDVCGQITEELRKALVTVEGSTNDFGDAQLSVDVRMLSLISM